MDKLFIHLFTEYLERYRDTSGALRAVDDILNTTEPVLLKNLQDAYNQSHLVRHLMQNGIGLMHFDIGSGIDMSELDESALEGFKTPDIKIETLRRFINEQIETRK